MTHMQAAKLRMKVYRIYCANKYWEVAASNFPGDKKEAEYWYMQYLVFAENHRFM